MLLPAAPLLIRRQAISSGGLILVSRQAMRTLFKRKRSRSLRIAMGAVAAPTAANSAPGLRLTVGPTGVIWRAPKAAHFAIARTALAIIRKTGTTRESPWIPTIQTGSFSIHLTFGLQHARERSGMILRAVTPTAGMQVRCT